MMKLDKKIWKSNEEWKDKTGKQEHQTYSQGDDKDGNDASSDSSYSDIEENGLDKNEFVDDTGKSITADQVCDSLATVLKKHQEKLNQDLEDMAQRGSFEEKGVFIPEEESIKEDDDMEIQ